MALRGHATKGSVSGGTNLITKREGKIHSGGDVGLWLEVNSGSQDSENAKQRAYEMRICQGTRTTT